MVEKFPLLWSSRKQVPNSALSLIHFPSDTPSFPISSLDRIEPTATERAARRLAQIHETLSPAFPRSSHLSSAFQYSSTTLSEWKMDTDRPSAVFPPPYPHLPRRGFRPRFACRGAETRRGNQGERKGEGGECTGVRGADETECAQG